MAGDRCGETSPRVADAGVCQSTWGYPMPEALALGELWMAKKLYPARYQSIDVDSKAGGLLSAFLPRGVDARCPLTIIPGWCRVAWALVTSAIAVASLCFGQYPLSLSAVGHTPGPSAAGEGVIGQIVWSVRLPRVVMALLAGGALGLCGATLQGVFQNPLVDPHIIGVTAGSAFGGTLAILLGVGSLLMMASTFSSASSRWG